MTAPASIPALIAEGRRLIAAATKGLAVACYETEADGSEGRPIVCLGQDHSGPLMSSDSTQGLVCLTTEDRDRFVFAVNNLAALLDVVEAAERFRVLGEQWLGMPEGPPETDKTWAEMNAARNDLFAALSALGLGQDDGGKEKGNG